MKIYFQNPGGTVEFPVDDAVPDLSQNFDIDMVDSFRFKSNLHHILMGARIAAFSDAGRPRYVGVVASITYPDSGPRTYDCIPAEGHLRYRISPRVAHPGGVGLVLSDILSSDPPTQGAGDNQYCQGLLWLARSAVTAGITSWGSDGVGRLAGWRPKATDRNVYIDGRLLSLVSYANLTAGTYRCAIDGDDLCIYGQSPGDTYGVVAVDGFAENWLRLGDLSEDPEIENLYLLDSDYIWVHVRDIIKEMGLYPHVRRDGGIAYLDILDSPYRRSSEASPVREVRNIDIKRRSRPAYPPHSAAVGVGEAGDILTGARAVVGRPGNIGQAWSEIRVDLGGAMRSPWGSLDRAVDDILSDVQMKMPITADLLDGEDVLPGDWYVVDGDARLCRSVSYRPPRLASAVFGAPDISIPWAMASRRESGAIEQYRAYLESIEDGEALRYAYFGATEGFDCTFKTINFGAETPPILISLSVVDPEDVQISAASVSYVIILNGHKIRLPWQRWGPTPLTDFDIRQYCYLDGSENSIEIYIDDPGGWVPDDYVFELQIRGLGADSDPPSVSLTIANSTLNDMNTATYFEQAKDEGTKNYTYSVSDEEVYPSLAPTVKIWNRNSNLGREDWYSDVGLVVWYGECATRLVVGGTVYLGSWARRSGWHATSYTTNPKTGNAWTWDEINGISAGGSIRMRASYYPSSGSGTYSRLHDAYVEVLP